MKSPPSLWLAMLLWLSMDGTSISTSTAAAFVHQHPTVNFRASIGYNTKWRDNSIPFFMGSSSERVGNSKIEYQCDESKYGRGDMHLSADIDYGDIVVYQAGTWLVDGVPVGDGGSPTFHYGLVETIQLVWTHNCEHGVIRVLPLNLVDSTVLSMNEDAEPIEFGPEQLVAKLPVEFDEEKSQGISPIELSDELWQAAIPPIEE